jgi:hypothetical protein
VWLSVSSYKITAERIEVARRLIDASVTLIKSQEDYVLALNRAGMHVPAMLAFELLLIMRATLAFREARLRTMLRTEVLFGEMAASLSDIAPPGENGTP